MHHRCTQQQFVLHQRRQVQLVVEPSEHFPRVVVQRCSEANVHGHGDRVRECFEAALALHAGLHFEPTAHPHPIVAFGPEGQVDLDGSEQLVSFRQTRHPRWREAALKHERRGARPTRNDMLWEGRLHRSAEVYGMARFRKIMGLPLAETSFMPPRLLLASSSTYRQALLSRLRIPFDAAAPNVDETPCPKESVAEMTLRLAEAKATALRASYPGYLIVGSDQAAELDGAPLGKPGNEHAARAQLLRMSDRTVVFHTAVCVLDADSGRTTSAQVPTRVSFRPLPPALVDRYIQQEPAFDCAGSFKSEALGVALCREIASTDPTALVGLPLIALVDLLARFGLELPAAD